MKRTKKSLAFVLAVAMMLTMIPASVFAATTNDVAKVPTVAAEGEFESVMSLELKGNVDIDEPQRIRLSLENAEWDVNDNDATNVEDLEKEGAIEIEVNGTPATGVEFHSSSKTSAEISLGTDSLSKEDYYTITMHLIAGEDVGEAKVTVEGMDSQISSGTYTIAVIAGDSTIAKVVGDPKTTGRTEVTAAQIEIREAALAAVRGDQKIKLTLPKGFEWSTETKVSGDMAPGKVTPTVGSDPRDLFITFTADDSASNRRLLVITPVFNVTKKAAMGDITVQIRNQEKGDHKISDASGMVVAIYGEEGVSVTTVKESKLPEIYAGYEFESGSDSYTVEVTLEENMKDSLVEDRYVDFEFPEWVQLTSREAVKVKLNGVEATTDIVGDGSEDQNTFEWTVEAIGGQTWKENGTNKAVFTIPITVEAKHTEDIVLTVSGAKAGVAETDLVVAKAVAPITADVNIADIKTGIQSQTGGNIVIKEVAPGAIRDRSGDKLTVSISDLGFGGMKFDDATVKVTKGDLEINEKKVEVDDGVIVIPIERTSIREAAEITISDVSLNLDRTMPEGNYNVTIAGSAVVDNADYDDGDFAGNAVKEKYLNIITPADGKVYGTAKFQLGAKEYSVLINGKEQTYQMDTAAFTQNQRTMIPVKFVAQALGVSEDNVVWNGTAKTATFFKGDRVCVLTAGSNIMNVNGAEVVMDSAAFVKDKRIFVPIKYVANALGCSVEWDGTTKTVTINQ